jgi:hypothetical protein
MTNDEVKKQPRMHEFLKKVHANAQEKVEESKGSFTFGERRESEVNFFVSVSP